MQSIPEAIDAQIEAGSPTIAPTQLFRRGRKGFGCRLGYTSSLEKYPPNTVLHTTVLDSTVFIYDPLPQRGYLFCAMRESLNVFGRDLKTPCNIAEALRQTRCTAIKAGMYRL